MQVSPAKQTSAQYSLAVPEVSTRIFPFPHTTGDFIVDGVGSKEKPSCQ